MIGGLQYDPRSESWRAGDHIAFEVQCVGILTDSIRKPAEVRWLVNAFRLRSKLLLSPEIDLTQSRPYTECEDSIAVLNRNLQHRTNEVSIVLDHAIVFVDRTAARRGPSSSVAPINWLIECKAVRDRVVNFATLTAFPRGHLFPIVIQSRPQIAEPLTCWHDVNAKFLLRQPR